jgi:AcrR family transcriptional regulator
MPRTRHTWPPEDEALLRAEYGRTPTRDLAARIGVTPGAINQRAKKLKLDAGRAVWTPDRIAQLRGLYATRSAQECADLMGLTYKQIVQGVTRARLRKSREWIAERMREAHQQGIGGGQRTRFAPGHATWNAGLHGLDIGGKQTRFQPGQRNGRAAQLWRPIGSESIDAYGYPIRKVADTGHKPSDWRWIHHLVWEAAGRDIPPGHALVFRDGDKRNAAIDNLELITRAELMARNSVHRYPEHIVRAVQAVGALNRQINRRARAA